MSDNRGATAGRVRALVLSHASGALVAQVWQAVASFALQVIAAHLLGAKGLGVVALCLGVIVMATAVTSGFVGDALTVLDRHDAGVRGGLQAWTVVLGVVGPVAAALVLGGTGVLDLREALLFLAAATLFQVEEVARRVLMATLRFWRLVAVDSTALVVSVLVVGLVGWWGEVTLGTFFGAIAVGQLAGLVVAVALAPSDERRLVPLRGADLRSVAGFGAWRGAQVAVNPTVFTVMRVLVVASAGSAALGQVEAARIYVAPAILAIQGIGSYLLASYARDRALPLVVLQRRALRGSLALAAGALLLGGVLWAGASFVGPWVTGGSFDLPGVSVLGWSVYAAATATLTPFVSLAAARGRQRAALAVRGLDASISIGSLAALLALGMPFVATPFVLAIGPLAGGLITRGLVLAPLARRDQQRGDTTSASPDAEPLVATAELGKAVHHAR